MANEKQHAHELIEQLPPHQLSAVVGLLEAIIDPVSRKLAAAPIDDEPETEEERREVEQSKEWLRQRGGKGIPHEEGDVKLLTDSDPKEYRLRVGDYRVRFYNLGDTLQILSVRHRREAYR